MTHFVLIQFIGLVAVTISLGVFQTNKREKMLKLGMMAAVLYAVHFYLLGAFTGAAMNLIGAARCYAFFRVQPSGHNIWILAVFSGASVAGAVLTWQGPLSILPMAGSLAWGVASWQKKPKYIRRLALIPPPLWFTYNAISQSYPGMLIEIIMLGSNLVGEYRFDIRHKAHARMKLARPA